MRRWLLRLTFTVLRRVRNVGPGPLVLLALAVIVAGNFAFRGEAARVGQRIGWDEALYYTLGLFTFQTTRFGFGKTPLLELLEFLAPAISFFALFSAIARMLEERGSLLAGRLRDHTVIGGLGNLGTTIAQYETEHRRPFVAVERDGETPSVSDVRASAAGAVLVGDMTSASELRRAGCHRASRVFLTAQSDIANLDAAFQARRLVADAGTRHPPTIFAHVYDAALADALAPQLRSTGDRADIVAFNSYRFAAKALVAQLVRDGMVPALRVAPGLELRRTAWPPRGERLAEPSAAAALEEDRRRVRESFRLASDENPATERYAIVGLGRFGRSVVHELLAAMPRQAQLLVIERDAGKLDTQLGRFSERERARLEPLVADAASPAAGDALHRFGARVVMVCTDSDVGNLRLALELHRRQVLTVTRMFDLEASHELARGLAEHGLATVGLARLFRAAIPILTHERRLRACVDVDYGTTPEVDHLFYLSHVTADERRELGPACLGLDEIPADPAAPTPPEDVALVWHRAVKHLSPHRP